MPSGFLDPSLRRQIELKCIPWLLGFSEVNNTETDASFRFNEQTSERIKEDVLSRSSAIPFVYLRSEVKWSKRTGQG